MLIEVIQFIKNRSLPFEEKVIIRHFGHLFAKPVDENLGSGFIHRRNQIGINNRVIDHQAGVEFVVAVAPSICRGLRFDKIDCRNSRITQIIKDGERC